MSSYLVDAAHLTAGFDPVQYASDFVRGYCKQKFDYVVGDVELVNPRPDSSAQLKELPVEAVTLVEAWMISGATGQFAWQTLTDWAWTPEGYLYDTTPVVVGVYSSGYSTVYPSWPRLPKSLRVTYTHGFQTIPDDLQGVVLRIAAELEANPSYAHSEKVGEVNTVWENNSVQNGAHIFLRDQDKAILDNYAQISVT